MSCMNAPKSEVVLRRIVLIAVKDRAVVYESHGFTTCMRVRTTNWPVAKVKMIVHQQNEGIVHLEVFGRHDGRS